MVTGIVIGIFIGVILGVWIVAMCKAAGRGEHDEEPIVRDPRVTTRWDREGVRSPFLDYKSVARKEEE